MKSVKSLFVLFFVLFLGTSLSVNAQFVSTNGPTGGGVHMYDFIEHDGAWFLAANDFILKSTNEGGSWTVLSDGLPQVNISPRAFASFNGQLYVSTNSQYRILRSADVGATWQQFNTGMPTFFGVPTFLARKMVVNNGRLIALPHGREPVHYLDEGASSWTATSFSGVDGGGIRVITGNTLYANIGSNHRVSTDNGATWTAFPSNPPNSVGNVGATDYLKVGDRIIVTTNAGGNNGIYYSDNNLQSWSVPQGSFYSGDASTEKMLYVNDDYILALSGSGIMKSTDQGSSWTELTTEETRPDGTITTFMKQLSGDRVLVGSTSGLYMYGNNGQGEFSQVNVPLGKANVYDTFDVNGQLYTFHEGRVGRYDKGVNRWRNAADLRDLGVAVGSPGLALDHQRMHRLGNNLVLLGNKKAFISPDGENFTQMTGLNGLIPVSFHSVGNTWIMVTGVPGGFNNWVGGAIHYSEDEGQTWTQATAENFPTFSSFSPNFNSTDLVDVNGTWFLTGNSRVYRSTDQGRNWTVINVGAGSRYTFYAFDGALFAVYDDNIWWGIRKSTDNGNTWQDYYNGLPNTNSFSRQVWGMTSVGNQLVTYNDASDSITPEPGETGFYVLNSANGSWQRDTSIPNLSFIPKGLLAFEGDIYAVWENVGIYTNGAVSTSIEFPNGAAELPGAIRLNQNYPNPFNPSTVINFELNSTGEVLLQVFDLLGREVATLVNSRVTAGSHSVNFDASRLSSGVYVYRLQAGNQVMSRKMVLLK
jgi:photosystem II stability/assembly factor-like uncharacterized protein